MSSRAGCFRLHRIEARTSHQDLSPGPPQEVLQRLQQDILLVLQNCNLVPHTYRSYRTHGHDSPGPPAAAARTPATCQWTPARPWPPPAGQQPSPSRQRPAPRSLPRLRTQQGVVVVVQMPTGEYHRCTNNILYTQAHGQNLVCAPGLRTNACTLFVDDHIIWGRLWRRCHSLPLKLQPNWRWRTCSM